MPSGLFKIKSGGSSSTMFPPATGCEGPEVGRWLVVALGHLELAAQPTSRSRRSCEAMVSGRSGTATAQPARTAKSPAPTANFKVFQFADVSGRTFIMSSPPRSDAICWSVWLRWFNCGLWPNKRGELTLMNRSRAKLLECTTTQSPAARSRSCAMTKSCGFPTTSSVVARQAGHYPTWR
jgi:hypothetical protein